MFFGIALLILGGVAAGLLWTGHFKQACGTCASNSAVSRSKAEFGP